MSIRSLSDAKIKPPFLGSSTRSSVDQSSTASNTSGTSSSFQRLSWSHTKVFLALVREARFLAQSLPFRSVLKKSINILLQNNVTVSFRLMPAHLQIPELYYLLFGLALGQPMRVSCGERIVSVERVWGAAWGAAAPARQSPAALSARITLCADAVVVLLAAVRALVHADKSAAPDWLADHPVAIVQVWHSYCIIKGI